MFKISTIVGIVKILVNNGKFKQLGDFFNKSQENSWKWDYIIKMINILSPNLQPLFFKPLYILQKLLTPQVQELTQISYFDNERSLWKVTEHLNQPFIISKE